MKKKTFLLSATVLCSLLFAKDQVFNLDNAIIDAEKEIDSQVKSVSISSCVGKWLHKSDDNKIEIECLSNGAMQIKHVYRKTTVIWRGIYSATSDTILFHVHESEVKQNFSKTTSFEDYYWQLAYKITGEKEIVFYSKIEPNEDSQFSYTTEQKFVKIRK